MLNKPHLLQICRLVLSCFNENAPLKITILQPETSGSSIISFTGEKYFMFDFNTSIIQRTFL